MGQIACGALDNVKRYLYKQTKLYQEQDFITVQEVLYIDDVVRAAALLQPIRLELLKRMAEPRTCPYLAGELGVPTQQINYHMRKLADAGLVDRIDERRVRGTVEGIYQARAASYWLSPALVGRLGARRAENEVGLSFLLSLAEDLQADVAKLAGFSKPSPCLGLSLHVELADPDRRAEFLAEVERLTKELADKYGAAGTRKKKPQLTYRFLLACYETLNNNHS
jgi:predicted transcriptional regulator